MPKNITRDSNNPWLVQKTVFYLFLVSQKVTYLFVIGDLILERFKDAKFRW